MIEYIDESLRTINEANDVDHRQLSRSEGEGGMNLNNDLAFLFTINSRCRS